MSEMREAIRKAARYVRFKREGHSAVPDAEEGRALAAGLARHVDDAAAASYKVVIEAGGREYKVTVELL